MLFRSFLVLVSIMFATEAQAGRSIPDDNLAYSVFIMLKSGSSGSGFFLAGKKFLYLVTAKHVLIDNSTQSLLSDGADLTSYSKDPKDATPNHISLDLKVLQSAGNILYKKGDVVAVRLAKIERNEGKLKIEGLDGLKVIGLSQPGIVAAELSTLTKFDDVLVANEVIVFGYPVSIGLKDHPQLDYERPLLRKGIVAGLNYSQHSIVLDCPSYPGNSGAPVIQVEEEGIGGHKFHVIGVISEFVPSLETWVNTNYKYFNSTMLNSGYSIATPIDLVLELLGNDT
jgi:V8-like Glu-specific endopeptidase